MLISPYQFIGQFNINGTSIFYAEKRELGQGGPIIGNIIINGKEVCNGKKTAEFGGPFLIYRGSIIASMLTLSTFSIVQIAMDTGNIVAKATPNERLILLKSVEENVVFYYNDLENKNLKSCPL